MDNDEPGANFTSDPLSDDAAFLYPLAKRVHVSTLPEDSEKAENSIPNRFLDPRSPWRPPLVQVAQRFSRGIPENHYLVYQERSEKGGAAKRFLAISDSSRSDGYRSLQIRLQNSGAKYEISPCSEFPYGKIFGSLGELEKGLGDIKPFIKPSKEKFPETKRSEKSPRAKLCARFFQCSECKWCLRVKDLTERYRSIGSNYYEACLIPNKREGVYGALIISDPESPEKHKRRSFTLVEDGKRCFIHRCPEFPNGQIFESVGKLEEGFGIKPLPKDALPQRSKRKRDSGNLPTADEESERRMTESAAPKKMREPDDDSFDLEPLPENFGDVEDEMFL